MLLLVGRQLCTPHSEADSSGPKRFYIAQDMFKMSCLPLSRTADVLFRSIHRTVGRKLLKIALSHKLNYNNSRNSETAFTMIHRELLNEYTYAHIH